jgi:hypothetical protein
MKSTEQIIQELSELKDSLLPGSGSNPRKPEDVLIGVIDSVMDLAKEIKTIAESIPHEASHKEVNEIFED